MAITRQGDLLTRAHRTAQLDLSRQAIAQAVLLWQMIDPADVEAKADAWAALMSQMILNYRSQSETLSAQYYQRFRIAEVGEALQSGAGLTRTPGGLLLLDLSEAQKQALSEQILTSLWVTGPVKVKQSLDAGRTPSQAMADALSSVSGAVQRHILNGGRDTVIGTVAVDDESGGWARVTDADPCAFCRMLAGRGAVYSDQETADFEAHDLCGCSVEPEYRNGEYNLPASTQAAAKDWAAFSEWKSKQADPTALPSQSKDWTKAQRNRSRPQIADYRYWYANVRETA